MDTPRIQLLDDRLAIRPDEPEKMTTGGILLPADAQKKTVRGTIVAVGPGRFNDAICKRLPLQVAIGNRVEWSQYGGHKIKLDGEELIVISEQDVLCVVA